MLPLKRKFEEDEALAWGTPEHSEDFAACLPTPPAPGDAAAAAQQPGVPGAPWPGPCSAGQPEATAAARAAAEVYPEPVDSLQQLAAATASTPPEGYALVSGEPAELPLFCGPTAGGCAPPAWAAPAAAVAGLGRSRVLHWGRAPFLSCC